jgi:transposase
MSAWETLTMSRKEVPRAGLLKAALRRQISNREVAGALGVSVRQAQRLKQRYRAEGAAGLCHRLRGRPSPRAVPAAIRERAGRLLATTYRDVNDCHATEKLREVDGLALSRAWVQRLRRERGLPAKHRRRPRAYRARRTPAARMGQLVQLDASWFDWLEGRGPALTLHGAIDDATGTVLGLVFRPTEDLHGYATLLHQLGTHYGLPVTLYGDRLNVFVRNDAHWTLEEQLQGAQHPTHFGRMLRALGIGFIAAGSPQAKGRIERLWRTLQDRLTVELRLRGLGTLVAAQAFLPAFIADFNRRFAHAAAEGGAAWRPAPRELAAELSCRYARVVGHDHTVGIGPRRLQLPRQAHGRSLVGSRVEVRECVDGRLLVLHHGQLLVAQPTTDPDFALTPRRSPSSERRRRPVGPSRRAPALALPAAPTAATPRASAGERSRPARTHPWRQVTTGFSRRSRRRTPNPLGGDILTEQLP